MKVSKLFLIPVKLIISILALYLAYIALSYFNFDLNYGFLRAKKAFISNKLWLFFFYIHLFFGAIAILSGLPLFFNKLISFKSQLHKNLGKLYVISILLFTGPTGLYLAFFAEGGSWASLGFILMSIAWMFPTYMSYKYVKQLNLVLHYKWIIRSYAMTLSGITLRLFMPLGASFHFLTQETTFIISSYVFVINIFLAEFFLYFKKENQIYNFINNS